jgi:hypothetical protein
MFKRCKLDKTDKNSNEECKLDKIDKNSNEECKLDKIDKNSNEEVKYERCKLKKDVNWEDVIWENWYYNYEDEQ